MQLLKRFYRISKIKMLRIEMQSNQSKIRRASHF